MKTIHTTLIAALLLHSTPVLAQEEVQAAAPAFHIEARDTIAGLPATVRVQGEIPEDAALLVLPPYGSEIALGIDADPVGTQVVIPGENMQEAGDYSVSIDLGHEILEDLTSFSVSPDTVDLVNSSVQVSRDTMASNGTETVDVTVILRDRYGNVIQDRPVRLISSRPTDIVQELTRQTDSRGQQLFSVSTQQAGSISLRAIDLISGQPLMSQVQIAAGPAGAIGGPLQANLLNVQPIQQQAYVQPTQVQPVQQQVAQQVTPPALVTAGTPAPAPSPSHAPRTQAPQYIPEQYGSPFVGNILQGRKLYGQVTSFDVVDSFVLEIPTEIEVNLDQNITITAIDSNGRVVEDYDGTVLLASTDLNAVLPSFGEVEFTGSDLGSKRLILGLRFGTPGEHVLYAEDSTNSNVNGEIVINVSGNHSAATEGTISIVSHPQDSLINENTIRLEGSGPPFVNLTVTGGEKDAFGETDLDGKFAIDVDLNPAQTDHTLRVRDQSGRYDSGNLRLKLDIVPPEIAQVTFEPVMPTEGDEVLVTARIIEDGPAPERVILTLDDIEYEMQRGESTEEGVVYQSSLTFDGFGTFQPKVSTADEAGNDAEVVSSIEVAQRGLISVQNVLAEARANAVALRWDPITEEEIDAYRIYVGEEEDEFLYTLDTDRATTAATVAGLRAGTTYYFGVTALQGERESEEKSRIISATVLGVRLQVRPEDSALTIRWSPMQRSVPLATYILKYGVDPDNLTEERTINGGLTQYALRDLINDVKYYIELIPVTTTGETLDDLVARGDGTPEGGEFYEGAPDPIPPAYFGSVGQPPTGGGDPIPPIKPIQERNPPPELSRDGLPFSGWWIAIAIGIFALYGYRQHRRSLHAAIAFQQSMDARYAASL